MFASVAIVVASVFLFSPNKRSSKDCLDPDKFKEFKLIRRTKLSHNVAKFTFLLPSPTSVLGLPIGQHISCRGKDSQGEEVIKPYTPTTLDSDVGYFELVIKMYPQGRMSHHFREMRVGDSLAVKGPKGRFKYQPGQIREFGMLAGGSGITPMFQVSRAILENSSDKTRVHLIYANVTYEDILVKKWEQMTRLSLLIGFALASVAIVVASVFLFSPKKRSSKDCLDPDNFKEFKLIKRTKLSHNVAKFTFLLPSPTSVLGLPIGQHISCRGKDSQGEEVIKPYTPTTLDSDVGYFELVIKMYLQGRMSHHFREMRVGESLAVKGPKGRFKYQPGQIREFGMLAGGSGITPMFQVARAILENPSDKTRVHLIYANVTYEDILVKEELDLLATRYPDQSKIYYVLNQPPEVWEGGVGFVSKEMIQTHFPAPAPGIQILRCGPPPMNKAMAAHLEALGYTPEMQFQF